MSTESNATKTYRGGCHCGAVRYEVEMGNVDTLMACNCSICSRKGHLLTFVPAPAFKLLSGENAVTDYQFNKHRIHHLFCATCGIGAYGTGTGPNGVTMVSINARCLDDFDFASVPVKHFDGKSM